MKSKLVLVGKWSFIVALVLAILIALIPNTMTNQVWIIVLIVLGVIVGLLNIQDKEITQFLVASISIMLSGIIFGMIGGTIVGVVSAFAGALSLVAGGAAFVVSIKAIISLGKN